MNAGPDDYVDHINRNRLDNRKCNLRLCTQQENMRNVGLRSDNKSGVKGVHFCKTRRKWVAQIKVDLNKYLLLGRFLDFDDAIKAREDAEKKYFGSIVANEDMAKAR